MQAKTLITFYSVQHAYRAEKICKNTGINCELVVVPMSLSQSCNGLALELDEENIVKVIEILKENNVRMALAGVHAKEQY